MFYQAFVGLLLRERFLEGNDTHEIKPILAVSRNANVGTNRAEVCAEQRGGGGKGRGRQKDFARLEGGEAVGEASSHQDRQDGGRTGHWREREEPKAGCRSAKGSQHHHCHSTNL